jgi:hypothetical protein
VAKTELVEGIEALVHVGSTWPFALRALDSLGRPVPGVELEASVPHGRVESGVSDEKGVVKAKWTTGGNGEEGSSSILLRAWGPIGTEPARLSVWTEDGACHASITDLAGLPVPGQKLLLGDKVFVTLGDGKVALGALPEGPAELRHAQWPGLRVKLYVRKSGVFPSVAPPGRVALTVPVTLAPPLGVNVRIEREGDGLAWWLEAPTGELLEGRDVELTVNGRESRVKSKGHSQVGFEKGVVQLTVVDVETHVGAAAEVHR